MTTSSLSGALSLHSVRLKDTEDNSHELEMHTYFESITEIAGYPN